MYGRWFQAKQDMNPIIADLPGDLENLYFRTSQVT